MFVVQVYATEAVKCARLSYAQLVRLLLPTRNCRGFIARPCQGLNFGQPSFAIPRVDRDISVSVYWEGDENSNNPGQSLINTHYHI